MFTKIESLPLALQVEWRMPADRAEARVMRKQRATMEFVTRSSGSRDWYGFHDRCQGAAHAAALLIGAARPDAIVFWPLPAVPGAESTQAWICALKGGMPVVGCDKVLPIGAARQTLENWAVNEFPQSRVVGPLAGGRESVPELLASLQQDPNLYKAALRAARLRKPGAMVRRIVLGTAAVAAAAGAVVGLNTYSHSRATRVALESKARAAAAAYVPDPALIAKQRELEARRRQEATRAAVAAFRQRVEPGELWAAANAVRRTLPVSVHGFQPQWIECAEQECRVQWQGKGRFTSPADREFLPNVQRATAVDLAATSVFPLALAARPMRVAPDKTVEDLAFGMKTRLAQRVQSLQVDAAQPALQQLLQKGETPLAAAGNWRVALTGPTSLISATAVVEQVSQWPMRLKAVKYQYGSGGVELSGDYLWTVPSPEGTDAH